MKYISVPRDLLSHISYEMDNLERVKFEGRGVCSVAEELRTLLAAPAAEVEGLEAVMTLIADGEDGPVEPLLCSLPKAQAIIDTLKAENEKLEREIIYLMGQINGSKGDV